MIKVCERYRPFSHQAGSQVMVPYTNWQVRAYPTRIECIDQEGKVSVLDLKLTGPVKEFTLMLDLEKKVVRIFGTAKEGYYHICIFAGKQRELRCFLERGSSLTLCHNGKEIYLKRGESFDLSQKSVSLFEKKKRLERLSFGVTKKLDVDLVWRRKLLPEVLPILFHLGQQSPEIAEEEKNTFLFETTEELQSIIFSHFFSVFAPDLHRQNYLGLSQQIAKEIQMSFASNHLPWVIYQSLRSMLIQKEEEKLYLLPKLPKEFIAGRLVDVELSDQTVSMEWTKGKIRRAVLETAKDCDVIIECPKHIQKFRLRKNLSDRGKYYLPNQKIFLSGKNRYILDKFMK